MKTYVVATCNLWGASNEYPEHVILWTNKKNTITYPISSGAMAVDSLEKFHKNGLKIRLCGFFFWELTFSTNQC